MHQMSLVLARTSSLKSKSECAGEPADNSSLPAKLANNLDEGDNIRFSCSYIIIQVLYVLQLLLEGLNGSGQALVLCNQGGNVIMHVMVLLELSCNSPVLLGS